MTKTLFTLCIAMATLFVLGCEKNTQPSSDTLAPKAGAPSSGKDVKAPAKPGGSASKSKPGKPKTAKPKRGKPDPVAAQAPSGKVTIPSDFPKDVPLPLGFRLNSAITLVEGRSFMITGTSHNPPSVEADFFEKELTEAGWTPSDNAPDMGGQASRILVYEKGDRTVRVMIIEGKGGDPTAITINI